MLKELVAEYQTRDVPIPDWLRAYGEQSIASHVELGRKQHLVRALLILARDKNALWLTSESGSVAVAVLPSDSVIVIREETRASWRWSGGTFYIHVLTLFEGGKEIITIKEQHEGHDYDESSAAFGRYPLTDLYDLAMKGERRIGHLAHMCGLYGFGELGDVCPACQGKNTFPHVKDKVPY